MSFNNAFSLRIKLDFLRQIVISMTTNKYKDARKLAKPSEGDKSNKSESIKF